MPKRLNWKILAIAAACAGAALVGLGLGLFVFPGPRGPTQGPVQTDEAMPTCGNEAPLDDSKVPEAGAALDSALEKAVALYFMCRSLPIEQFSRTFATLSVVIAQYAPDPECFRNDATSLSPRWSDHKNWADQQGRADALMANLRLKIGYALACLSGDQQRLFYVDMAHALAFATAGHAMQSFVNPTFRGERVDRCLDYGRDCDELAARSWCGRFGYSRITKWEWLNAPRTLTLGDHKTCTGVCGAFTTIVCAE